MAKIIAKTSFTTSNLNLHIADKGGTDVALAFVAGVEWTLTSATAAWITTGAADADGVINRGLEVGDEITLSHADNAVNEGITGDITTVTATVVTFDLTTGSPVAETAGADMNIVATKKTYQTLEVGDMNFVDGFQGIVLGSKLVDMWDLLNLDKYNKPFTSIEPRAKSLASLYGWEPHDTNTLDSFRDTALEIRATPTSAASKIYALWRSGSLNEATDQFNFWPSSDAPITAPTSAVMAGYVNQLFLIYDVAGADNRQSNGVTWFTRCAEVGKTIVMEEHDVNYAEIMPVSAANQLDPKLVESDVNVSTLAKYTDIDWTDNTLVYAGDVNSVSYDFNGFIQALSDGSNQDNQTVHEKINYLWRQPTDINQGDAGVLRGDKQWPLTVFSGNVFTILDGYLLNYKTSQRNDLRVTDITPTLLQWPSVMTLSVLAALLAIGGTFTIWHKNGYRTNDAFVFQDENDVAQQDIAIAALVDIVMAYSTYSLDGHIANTPLDVVISYNRPGFIEPDNIETTLAGTNISASLSLTADPSYI